MTGLQDTASEYHIQWSVPSTLQVHNNHMCLPQTALGILIPPIDWSRYRSLTPGWME